MNLIDDMQYVMGLALTKSECTSQIASLKHDMKELIPLKEMHEVEKKKISVPLYFGIFGFSELFLGKLISVIATDVLSRELNNGWSYKEYAEGLAPMAIYHFANIPWIVGSLLALPITLLVLLLSVFIVKRWNGIINNLNQKNKEALYENKDIKARNERIRQHNLTLHSRIQEQEERIVELENALQLNVPWFPKAYLNINAVDFIFAELQSGRSQNIEQAIGRYEAVLAHNNPM